jgi:cytosine deaminase
MDIDEVCRQAHSHRYGGRVTVGHVTKLSALPSEPFAAAARRLAGAGVAVTVLPATDLFLMGRGRAHDVPRGVAPAHRLMDHGVSCSIATNNVLNPFTPFGDCSLVRMANLYANVAQIGRPPELAACFEMITSEPARLMRLDNYGIIAGNPADLVVLDCEEPSAAVAELSQPVFGIKNGRRSFTRSLPELHAPH